MVAFGPGYPDFSEPFLKGPEDDEAELASKIRHREEREAARRPGRRPRGRIPFKGEGYGCLTITILILVLWAVGKLLLNS